MSVLLTGATGFVGRQVHRALAARGVPVVVVLRAGTEARLAGPATRVTATPDLFAETPAWWARACAGIETIVHAAWYAESGQYLHSPKNDECLAGTLALARGAVAAGVRRFVGIGTCFEYDVAVGLLTTKTRLNPQTPYAAAKASVFRALSELLPSRGIGLAWCRLFYLYGEGEDERRLVPYLRHRLSRGEPAELTSGTQIRDFLDVAEAGRMIADVALGTTEGAINVCSGVPVTVRELAERICDEYGGRRHLLHFGARPDNAFDPPRIVGVR
ncbi:MAG: NAD-dependent epimerase/dehydratase family protein [Pseudolabrys sp.]